jgi:hypothetical protein
MAKAEVVGLVVPIAGFGLSPAASTALKISFLFHFPKVIIAALVTRPFRKAPDHRTS